MVLTAAEIIVISYLLGSISFAVLVSHAMRLPDPRSFGSGNPGATNVLRGGRKTAAALTLLGDSAKGAAAIALALWWSQRAYLPLGDAVNMAALAALAVVLGHMYPVFFRFRGGKGVSTALGVLAGLDWRVALGVIAVWLVMAAASRLSSLAAITAAAAAPAIMLALPEYSIAQPCFQAVLVIMALVIWRHRGNIRKILAGTESRIGQKKT